MRLFLLSGLIGLALVAPCTAQDSGQARIPDSLTFDTIQSGPRYQFTGAEDPALLASIVRYTYQLGKQDAGVLANPAVLCLYVGRDSAVASNDVLTLLAGHTPPVRAGSACTINMRAEFAVTERATGKRAWLLRISALRHVSAFTVYTYSSFYVGPLFAAAWTCRARRARSEWQIDNCIMRWIS